MNQAELEQLMAPTYDEVRRRTYLALDVPSWAEAKRLVQRFGPAVDGYKVGLELFSAHGPAVLEYLADAGKRVFLDVKLHDIPNTVAGALRALCQYPLEMVNLHASAGRAVMEAAREAVAGTANQPLLIAVTVLTSLDEEDLAEVGYAGSAAETVLGMARLAARTGLDGIVASAQEVRVLRHELGDAFEIVVPGTRPGFAARDDQRRSLTPGEAVRRGASRLVIGRAVTRAPEPERALRQIWDEMQHALAEKARMSRVQEGNENG
jgi:orotidine-5'-phosphate decarboxylase